MRAARRQRAGLRRDLCCRDRVRQLAAYPERMQAAAPGEIEELSAARDREYIARFQGGSSGARGEIVRPDDMGLAGESVHRAPAGSAARACRVAASNSSGPSGRPHAPHITTPPSRLRNLDETLATIRLRNAQVRRQRSRTAGAAMAQHQKHIRSTIIAQMRDLGVFGSRSAGLSAASGGQGIDVRRLGGVSRGYIGVGALGTGVPRIRRRDDHRPAARKKGEIGAAEARSGEACCRPRSLRNPIAGSLICPDPRTRRGYGGCEVYTSRQQRTWITHTVQRRHDDPLVRTNQRRARPRGLSHADGREA